MSTETVAGTPAREQATKKRRRQQKVGRVTSDKMQKTIVVSVESLKRDRLYKRQYKYTTKFKAHDEHNDARIGDVVRIEETRPLSKDKRWRLVEIVKRAVQVKSVEQVVQELEPELEPEVEPAEGEGESEA
jgi:small subunit ribosomal protein S17